jgi:hypothetical protein
VSVQPPLNLLVVRRKGRDGPEQTESNVSNSGFQRRPLGHARPGCPRVVGCEQQCKRELSNSVCACPNKHAFAHGVHNVVSNTRCVRLPCGARLVGHTHGTQHTHCMLIMPLVTALVNQTCWLLVIADAIARGWMMRNPLVSGMLAQQVQTRAPAAC